MKLVLQNLLMIIICIVLLAMGLGVCALGIMIIAGTIKLAPEYSISEIAILITIAGIFITAGIWILGMLFDSIKLTWKR